MVYSVKIVRFLMNNVIFHELCDWMRFEVDCAKSHHRIISEGLIRKLKKSKKKTLHHLNQP